MRTRKITKVINVKLIESDISIDDIDRLFANVRFESYTRNLYNKLAPGPCWVRGEESGVYTESAVGGKSIRSHRISYEIFKGKKLEHYCCHHCDTPACINPDHLFDGTNRENILDSIRKGRMKAYRGNRATRINKAEKRLRETYPNEKLDIKPAAIESLRDKLDRLGK